MGGVLLFCINTTRHFLNTSLCSCRFSGEKRRSRGGVKHCTKAHSNMSTQALNTVLPVPVSPASGPPWGDWRLVMSGPSPSETLSDWPTSLHPAADCGTCPCLYPAKTQKHRFLMNATLVVSNLFPRMTPSPNSTPPFDPQPPTFLSRLLVPEEWRAFRKPAVVDQRVGFFLDGGSSVWTRDSPPLNGPLMVSRAGSLLRRTWRGISERQERRVLKLYFSFFFPLTLGDTLATLGGNNT